MKYFLILFLLGVAIVSCSGEKENDNPENKAAATRPLIVEDENGRYTEWYPGHKQIKIQGRKDKEGRRDGIWKMYSPQGVELSVTVYTAGKKDGHIIVKHPNGTLHYRGEYVMDERVGEWRFYDEQGALIQREFYDEK
ncbi:MAG: hypothetical protein R3277_02290 [Brumimicrobium sp.]|nr:hypothetical protein [Brumimicrobium sp.]